MPTLPQKSPESWPALASLVEDSEDCLRLDQTALQESVNFLKAEALLPIFVKNLRSRGVFDRMPVLVQEQLAWEEARCKAASTALWFGFEKVLEMWRAAGLTPCLIKGSYLALACYESPYLRPMSDVDVLFKDLNEAMSARDMLLSQGYTAEKPSIGGNPWALGYHLPALTNRATELTIEIHGSLVYAPKDRRCRQVSCLVERLQPFDYKGMRLLCLEPEANVVYGLVHNFYQHAAEGAMLLPLLDVRAILVSTGDAFDWPRLAELARRSVFSGVVHEGLFLTKNLFKAGVPEDTLERLRADSQAGASHVGRRKAWIRAKGWIQLDDLLHIGTPWDAVNLAFHRTFPSSQYVRACFPDQPKSSLAYLYVRRWWELARGVSGWLRARRTKAA
jgi:hypothetical protein